MFCSFLPYNSTNWHHVQMWELDHKEGWAPKNWCFQSVVLEKTLEGHLNSKEIKPVNPKGNQPWIFIGRADAEAEALILWPPDAKNQLIGKDPDAGKDWRQEEKETTEDEVVGWHHQLNGHEFEQTPGDSEGQGSLVCFGPWDRKGSNTTERLKKNIHIFPPSWSYHPYPTPRSSQSTRLGFLCYAATSPLLSSLHLIVNICWCYFLHSSHSLPPPLCPQVYSLHLHLHAFPANRFINIIFLDPIYMC